MRHAHLGLEAARCRPWAACEAWGCGSLSRPEARASCWHCRSPRIATASYHETVWAAGWQSRCEDDAGKEHWSPDPATATPKVRSTTRLLRPTWSCTPCGPRFAA